MSKQKRKVHPAANIFPMMNDADFEQLKASIEEIGLQEPVVLWKEQVIDGRNRLRACEELAIEPQEAELDDGVDPVAFAIAANQRRRNLTNKSQLAMCAAKMAGLKSGRPKTVQKCTVSEADRLAAEEAGKVFSVGRTQVFHALRVLREGCDKLIAQCENGDVAVSLACKLLDACDTKAAQTKVCKGGRAAIKEKVSPTDDASVCPNCGHDETDENGDCTKCHEPDVRQPDEPDPNPTNRLFDGIEATVCEYIANDPVRLEIAADRLEQLAAKLRGEQ